MTYRTNVASTGNDPENLYEPRHKWIPPKLFQEFQSSKPRERLQTTRLLARSAWAVPLLVLPQYSRALRSSSNRCASRFRHFLHFRFPSLYKSKWLSIPSSRHSNYCLLSSRHWTANPFPSPLLSLRPRPRKNKNIQNNTHMLFNIILFPETPVRWWGKREFEPEKFSMNNKWVFGLTFNHQIYIQFHLWIAVDLALQKSFHQTSLFVMRSEVRFTS